MQKLRVAMIVTGFPSKEKPLSGIFNLRAAQGFGRVVDLTLVHIRTWRPGREFITHGEVVGIPVITLAIPQTPWRGPLSMFICQEVGWVFIRGLLRSCDVVHSVGVNFAGLLSGCWASRSRIPHVAQAIGSDVNLHAKRWTHDQRLRTANGVVCDSHTLEERFRALCPGAKNVRTIFRGVDLQRFNPAGPTEGPMAEKSPVRFLYLGGFPRSKDRNVGRNLKGGETLMAAWKAGEQPLYERGSSLLIAGSNGYEHELRRWRASLRWPDRVHIVGTIPPALIAACMRAADVVLLPSLYEGLPNVAMEASACGVAVFGSKIGGMSEVVEDGTTGLLLPAGVVESWRHALISYSNQPWRLQAMGNAGRKRMEKRFDSAQYPEQMLDLYRAAMAEPLTATDLPENIQGKNAREAEWPIKPLSTR